MTYATVQRLFQQTGGSFAYLDEPEGAMNLDTFFQIVGEPLDYASMTLEELQAANQHLWSLREQLKALQLEIVPFIEAAEAERLAAELAKADPALTQGIGKVTVWPPPYEEQNEGDNNG